jgi:hypothetical protein
LRAWFEAPRFNSSRIGETRHNIILHQSESMQGTLVGVTSEASKSAVNLGTPLVTASRIHDIPRRIHRDWASLEGSPLKEFGRNAVLPADFERELRQRILRL